MWRAEDEVRAVLSDITAALRRGGDVTGYLDTAERALALEQGQVKIDDAWVELDDGYEPSPSAAHEGDIGTPAIFSTAVA